MSPSLALGIDVGGTSIKTSVVDETGKASSVLRTPTPADDPTGEKTAAAVAELISRQVDRHVVAAIGLAVPGVVNEFTGTVVSAVNLGWTDLPFRRMVEGHLDLPLAFGQDVRTGAFAEASLGAARDRGVSVFMPIGTGISIGIIVEGVPLSSGGWAGEIGQLPVMTADDRGELRSLERPPLERPSLESVASASAIAERIGCATAKDAAELVRQRDPQAVRVWHSAVDALADAIAWTTGVVGAEVVVIGGGLGEAGPLLFDPLSRAVDRRLGVLRRPAIVPAAFGDLATTIGAGLLALRQLR